MPAILDPINQQVDFDAGTVRLFFSRESVAPDGHYRMFGGVCWPVLCGNVYRGAALLAGRHVDTGTVYVFRQREFVSVSHVIAPDGTLETVGVGPWFVENWSVYRARLYYQCQIDELAKVQRHRVHADDMIEPKPVFVDVHWSSDEHESRIISDFLERRQLRFKAGSPLQEQIAQHEADRTLGPYPMHHALVCMLTAVARKRA